MPKIPKPTKTKPRAKPERAKPTASTPAKVVRATIPPITVDALTPAQESFFKAYAKGQNLILSGAAGTGKTFIAIAAALKEIAESKYKKRLVIVRSVVPTRDMGFLPGTKEEKESAYTAPYVGLVNKLCKQPLAWEQLTAGGIIEFISTSFVRGITIDNAIILVDEFQNMDFGEADSVMTRVGDNSRIIYSGDFLQSDFERESDVNGARTFISIFEKLSNTKHIRFFWEDCVRSGLVKEYLMVKDQMGIR